MGRNHCKFLASYGIINFLVENWISKFGKDLFFEVNFFTYKQGEMGKVSDFCNIQSHVEILSFVSTG